MSRLDHCPGCGLVLSEGEESIRSLPQHRRFFALIKAVFHHWPESHPRQFADETECRKWLTMKAGHREIGATIPLVGVNKDRAMFLAEAAIRAAGSYAIPVIHGDTLVVLKPKSISFRSLGHAAFCKLNDEVDAVILAETGMEAGQVLRETEKAA